MFGNARLSWYGDGIEHGLGSLIFKYTNTRSLVLMAPPSLDIIAPAVGKHGGIRDRRWKRLAVSLWSSKAVVHLGDTFSKLLLLRFHW